MFEAYDFGQVGEVALHGEDTVDDDEFHHIGFASLQLSLEVDHVVVAEFELFGEGESSAVDDAGMVALIANDVVLASAYYCQYA